jgi:hypothetical protein
MDPLREYLYIDRARLDSYFEQISTPVTYDKVPIWKTAIALTGPSAEGQQARFARPFTQHEKIQRVREYLHGNTWPFATLVGTASRVTVPANAGYSRLRGLALWVAREANNRDDPKTVCLLEDYKRDPDPDDPVYDGSIYSALVVLLTDMALQHQSSASEDDIDRQTCEPYPKEGGTVDQAPPGSTRLRRAPSSVLRPLPLDAPHPARLLVRHRPRRGRHGAPGQRSPTHAVRRQGLAGDVLHDRDGTLADERDLHRVGAHAVARDAAGAWEALNVADA